MEIQLAIQLDDPNGNGFQMALMWAFKEICVKKKVSTRFYFDLHSTINPFAVLLEL